MAYATKEAKAAHGRRYYQENLERRRQQNADGYYRKKATSPMAIAIRSARARAKKHGIPCTITENDVPVPEVCPVLGIPIAVATGVHTDNSPTIDQINPRAGYIPGNVRVISYRANRLKCDATLEEVVLLLADFRNLQKEGYNGS